MGKSIWTTIGGFATAIGVVLFAFTDEPWHTIGAVLTAIGAAFTGTIAKQYNITGGTTSNELVIPKGDPGSKENPIKPDTK